MRTIGKLLLSIPIFALAAQVAYAEVDPDMTAKLQALYPKTKFQQVNKTEFPGLTEVVMGQNIAYVDPTGRYFLFGKIYDMKEQKDLTQSRLEEIQKVDMSKLDKSLAFKRVYGNGSRTLYLFSDPECPYCKQLEKSLPQLENVTVYTFMMPLQSIHPHAYEKAVAVWCAKDRAATWDDMMQRGNSPKQASCDNPIDKVLAMAEVFGINGTPTLFTEDGRKMAGARDIATLSKWIDAAVPKKTASKE